MRSVTAGCSARRLGDPPFRGDDVESEAADMDGFNAAVRSDEFAAAGKDADGHMGIPFTVAFAEIAELN